MLLKNALQMIYEMCLSRYKINVRSISSYTTELKANICQQCRKAHKRKRPTDNELTYPGIYRSPFYSITCLSGFY